VRQQVEVAPKKKPFWGWLRSLFTTRREPSREQTLGAQESRVLTEFCRQYATPFRDLTLLKLALTHRSYLSVTGQGPRESNERLEFLGDSVLGLVTSEFLYRRHPDEHEGQLTKTKSLLVSKAILSRRALRMGLGRFVLMSHSEVESGGRQRLSILADAFESVIGAIYLDQGFEASRAFIHKHLLAESDAITSDKRHTNYKSHLQEYVQNAFRTHPVYRIRSEYGPDHSKHFMVEVMVGKRTLGEGRGHNKKEAEQAAARDALEKVERVRRPVREEDDELVDDRDDELIEDRGRFRDPPHGRSPRGEAAPPARGRPPISAPPAEPQPRVRDEDEDDDDESPASRRRRRSRRGGRARHAGTRDNDATKPAGVAPEDVPEPRDEDDAAFTRAVRAETRELAGAFEGDEDDYESPRAQGQSDPTLRSLSQASPASEELAEPAPPSRRTGAGAPAPATEREPRFGRGRRRESSARAAESDAAEAAELVRVDPYSQSGPPDTVVPAVVDVVPSEPEAEPETDAERDSRIDEMEKALDNFGRRRSLDYGRRGRRK
jgi:ribonuclease III